MDDHSQLKVAFLGFTNGDQVLTPCENSREQNAIVKKVIELEKLVWKVAQERDANPFQELVAADAIMIFQSGIVRHPDYLKSLTGGRRRNILCASPVWAEFYCLRLADKVSRSNGAASCASFV
jgi:hypothetical protein